MATIGRWITRHPWRAIVAWLAFVVVAVGAMVATGTETLQKLLGDWNWYLPRALEPLPRAEIEAAPARDRV